MSETRGLFGKQKTESTDEDRPAIDALSVTNLSRRVRVLEERIFNMQKQQQMNEENLLEMSRSSGTEIKIMGKELADLRGGFNEIREKLERLSEQLESKASESEFLVYKKYLELWKPVNFVTSGEMERAIKSALGSKQNK